MGAQGFEINPDVDFTTDFSESTGIILGFLLSQLEEKSIPPSTDYLLGDILYVGAGSEETCISAIFSSTTGTGLTSDPVTELCIVPGEAVGRKLQSIMMDPFSDFGLGDFLPTTVVIVSNAEAEALNVVLDGSNCITIGTACSNTPGSGDVNQDGALNVLDAVAIIQFVLGNPISTPFDECFLAAADGNGDTGVNVLDGTHACCSQALLTVVLGQ
eukprot:scaffold1589_cov361-Prasinococcus_capsulatus_cf.AAC.6